jgi:hypothetical protein
MLKSFCYLKVLEIAPPQFCEQCNRVSFSTPQADASNRDERTVDPKPGLHHAWHTTHATHAAHAAHAAHGVHAAHTVVMMIMAAGLFFLDRNLSYQ